VFQKKLNSCDIISQQSLHINGCAKSFTASEIKLARIYTATQICDFCCFATFFQCRHVCYASSDNTDGWM